MGNFYTDVLMKDRRFTSIEAVRDPALLFPPFRAKIEAVMADVNSATHELRWGETYRSTQRQRLLFLQGATRLRTVGVHHYGLAVDLALYINGVYDGRGDHYYPILYTPCVRHGLVYGADWGDPPPSKHSFNDWDHIQFVTIHDQAALFAGQMYPGPDWVPSQVG